MKKFLLGVVLSVLLTANSALAMTFSQPVEIGAIIYPPTNGILIKNAISNSGSLIGKFQNENIYDRGIAQFGSNADAIFVHYAPHEELYFGSKNKSSAMKIASGLYGTTIFQIKNDSETKFYILRNNEATIGYINYVCLGKQKDGTFVKYFSTDELMQRYFGIISDRKKRSTIYVEKMYCQGSTIVIEYKRSQEKQLPTTVGEFRFKWDDKAQWFSVDHIVY